MNCWLNITSGRGPEECCRAVYLVMRQMQNEAESADFQLEMISAEESGEKNCFQSVLLELKGENTGAFVKKWQGTVQWIAQSPFRPNHRRKNWFVGVEIVEPPCRTVFSDDEVKVEVTRSSGPGGQHVNKTESAVRITHLPTGITSVASEERSQHLNRKLALARLAKAIELSNQAAAEHKDCEIWQAHNQLERGNPVWTFSGPGFREK